MKEIPCAPHVKQFFVSEYGAEPIPAHQTSLVGTALLCVLQKLPYRILASKAPATGDTTLKVQLPTSLKHYTLTSDAAKRLGKHFEKEFQRELIMFIKGQLMITQNELAAIKMFYQVYQIDQELYEYENARKIWRDYKNRQFTQMAKEAAAPKKPVKKAA